MIKQQAGTPRLRELTRVHAQSPPIANRQYITLPRGSHQVNQRNMKHSRAQFKVVLPNNVRQCGMLKGHTLKKENLSSKIPPPNDPERICEEILQKITSPDKSVDMQEQVDLMIRTTISKKFRAKARLNRTPSASQTASMDNYDKWSKLHHSEILAKCHEFQNVIERQRAEIDDLRYRLMERKKWEDIWKESLKTFFCSVREKLLKKVSERDALKEQLNVATAKLKIIEVTKSKQGEELNMLLPSGKFAKSLLQLAGRLSKTSPSQIEQVIKMEPNEEVGSEQASMKPFQCSGKAQISCRVVAKREHEPDGELETSKRRRTSDTPTSHNHNSPDSGWNSGELSDSSISSPPGIPIDHAYSKQFDDSQLPLRVNVFQNDARGFVDETLPDLLAESSSNLSHYAPRRTQHEHHLPSISLSTPPPPPTHFGEAELTLDRFMGDIFNDIQATVHPHSVDIQTDINFINPTFPHSAPWEDIDLKEPFSKASHDILAQQLGL